MKPSHLIAAAACTLAALSLAVPAQARVNERQHRQHHRIAAGVHSGDLTRAEAKGLRHQQQHIRHYEARSRADGPGLTTRERARIETMQDGASGSINDQRHDGQVRPR